MHVRPRYPHIVSTLALVVALASGGAYASSLAKNSVGSKQIKNGAIKAADVRPGALTGAEVADGSITGADVDESTLKLPAGPVQPFVVEGPYTFYATLSASWSEYARVTFTAPTAGVARIEAEATVSYNPSGTTGSYIDTLFYIDDDGQSPFQGVGAYANWPAPQPTGPIVQHPTTSDVVAVPAGTHTVVLHMRHQLAGGNFAGLSNAQIDVMFFPQGSAQPNS